jgi:hypothetical protein
LLSGSSSFRDQSGGFLLSHTGNGAVSSAPVGLTSVFGMGTGVTLPTKPPENFIFFSKTSRKKFSSTIE